MRSFTLLQWCNILNLNKPYLLHILYYLLDVLQSKTFNKSAAEGPDTKPSCIVYKFNCFCDKSYIGQTSRHLKTRIKEHLPTCVLKFMIKKPKNMTTTTENATKRSSVAEHLVINRKCAKKYDLSRLKYYITVIM